MKIKFILSLAISILLVSCKTNKVVEITPTPPAIFFETSGLKGKWILEYILPVDGKDIRQLYKIQKPYLNFVDETKVAGNNGCNNISGGYSVSGDYSIRFDTGRFASTRMFCEGLDEKVFLDALASVNKFDVAENGTKLVLIAGDIVKMSFVKEEK